MSSQAIGQRFMVSRGGCWQCVPDCRSRLAEVLTFSQVAYNGSAGCRCAFNNGNPTVTRRVFLSERSTGKKQQAHGMDKR